MKQWDALIQSAGQKYNVDPKLIAALVQTESSGNPDAYNAEFGATGLGQQIPATAKALGIDPKDPAQSIEGVAKLLNENLNRYGSPEQAVLAYHGGTDQANWGPKTQDYLRKVSANYGAPSVARASAVPDDEFETAFGARPAPAGATSAPVAVDEFEAAFGPRPTVAPVTAAAPATPAQAPVQPPAEPGMLATIGNVIPDYLKSPEAYGAQSIRNINALGRGISDVLDAPSEWLAAGAEKSGLTGLLGRAGINMPTAEQQTAINAQSRADYDARNQGGGFQEGASRIAGNLAGVLAPTIGGEAALVQGGRALSNAVGNPQLLTRAGEFLRGQGGLASRMTYNAAQGAAGGALLSGGQPDASLAESAGLGALMGGAVPVAGSLLKYGANTGKALVAPFTEAGRAGIAQRAIQGEAAKDPLNQAQNILAAAAPRSGVAAPATAAAGPATQAAARISADDAVNRAAAAGRIEANFDEIVPGSVPTLAQATGNAGLAALERAAVSRSPNAFAERNLANYAARNAYMTEIKGTPETLGAAIAKRDEEALPFLRSALDNARPANANPVMAEIDSILQGRAGQRDEVVKALGRVKDKLDLGENGLQSSVEQLYGIRQSINDQLATVAGRDNSAAQLASKELIQVRDKLDDSIQAAAPGFKEFLKTYSQLSRPVDAQRYLQGLDLTDQTSQRITLNKVKSAVNRIEKLRGSNGANEAKSISDEQLAMLKNLQTDLQREAHSSRGMAIGSNTFQNFATNQLIDTMMPGKLGAVAPVTPGAIGGALGLALGGNVGMGIGAIGGQQLGGIAGRAMNAQGPEIEARLIDYLLNPRGAEVLRAGKASQTPAMDALLRRATPVAPASIVTPGSQNNR